MAIGDALALGDHALEDLGLHALDVVHPLDLDVDQLDAVVGHHVLHAFEDHAGDLVPPQRDLAHGLGFHDVLDLLGFLEGAVGGAHDLDEIVAGNHVARFTVDDVVQPRLGAALVAQALEEQQGVGDAPARVGLHADVLLVTGGHLVGVSVPFQPALVEHIGFLRERHLHMQARLGNRLAHGLAELGDDDLFGFGDRVQRRRERDDSQQREGGRDQKRAGLHYFTS